MKILQLLKSIFLPFKKLLDNNLDLNTKQGASKDIAPCADILPSKIADNENIARFIFSPININLKKNTLKTNCFKPPNYYDEISVNRYDYTSASFLKTLALLMQNPSKDFYGLAIFQSLTVRKNSFDIVHTPIEPPASPINPFHSDIKIGHIVQPDEELPAEISKKIRDILKETTLYKDTNTAIQEWIGDNITL
ncbi:hypothetical protein [Elizabethkingia anophelis]|uniref:hypothetical protein n=1 Tax=Elizabethkingia anophelis TaxID=1117645 RepID=UPI0038917122